LKTRVPLHLGQISYSIYMVHFPLLAVVNGICRAAQGLLHVPLYQQSADGEWILSFGNVWLNDLFLVLLLVSIVGVATLSYRWIENPGREYFNQLAGRNRTRKNALAPATI
jgi:peptidoglycan/LPS O-acetylase OafA/YrhL